MTEPSRAEPRAASPPATPTCSARRTHCQSSKNGLAARILFVCLFVVVVVVVVALLFDARRGRTYPLDVLEDEVEFSLALERLAQLDDVLLLERAQHAQLAHRRLLHVVVLCNTAAPSVKMGQRC